MKTLEFKKEYALDLSSKVQKINGFLFEAKIPNEANIFLYGKIVDLIEETYELGLNHCGFESEKIDKNETD